MDTQNHYLQLSKFLLRQLVAKYPRFGRVPNEGQINADHSQRDCFSDITTFAIYQVIKAKVLTELLTKFDQLYLTDIRGDQKVMHEMQRLPKRVKKLYYFLRSELDAPYIEVVIKKNLVERSLRKVEDIYQKKHDDIMTIMDDLINIRGKIVEMCKRYECSSDAVTTFVQKIESNFVDPIMRKLDRLLVDNWEEEVSFKNAIKLVPSNITAEVEKIEAERRKSNNG